MQTTVAKQLMRIMLSTRSSNEQELITRFAALKHSSAIMVGASKILLSASDLVSESALRPDCRKTTTPNLDGVIDTFINLADVMERYNYTKDCVIGMVINMGISDEDHKTSAAMLRTAGNIADKTIAFTQATHITAFTQATHITTLVNMFDAKLSLDEDLGNDEPGNEQPGSDQFGSDQPGMFRISSVFDTKLSFGGVSELKFNTNSHPDYIANIVAAHDGNAINHGGKSHPHFRLALADTITGKKKLCWSWYVFPALREVRPFGSQYPEFLIPDFGAACQLLLTPLFRTNYITIAESINKRLEKGDDLEVMFGHDADKFRQTTYLFVLAAQFIGKTSYGFNAFIEDEVGKVLVRSLTLLNYKFHQKTFEVAQKWINERIVATKTPATYAAPKTPATYAAPKTPTTQHSVDHTSQLRSAQAAHPKEWACHLCTFLNNHRLDSCSMCGSAKRR
jgi:hypothetical protein